MGYVRKTYDVWELHVNYGDGYEYECTEYSRADAKKTQHEYLLNCPQYPSKIIKKRVRFEDES